LRALIRRVLSASVSVEGLVVGEIGPGLVLYLGVHDDDDASDLDWVVKKIVGLRVFEDGQKKMNLSLLDTGLELMLISQFTLYGSLIKGYRPSFNQSASPQKARMLYGNFISSITKHLPNRLATGEFGENMKIESIDDGPVSIWLDSKARNY
jgi:D-tyrosyl-tRNA(Tyr) deacylase